MASWLERFRGEIDLIYIDPPFDVGADFTMQVQIGEEGEALQKEQSILEAVAWKSRSWVCLLPNALKFLSPLFKSLIKPCTFLNRVLYLKMYL
jgi:16S rRNA G966 N2-methylase RsmD